MLPLVHILLRQGTDRSIHKSKLPGAVVADAGPLHHTLWRKQVQEAGDSLIIPFIYTILIQGDIRYTIFSGTDLAIRSV